MKDADHLQLRKAFGEHIRRLRQRTGVSQERLGDAAGLHRTYVGSVERGERNPTLETLAALATALDVSLPELVGFDARRR